MNRRPSQAAVGRLWERVGVSSETVLKGVSEFDMGLAVGMRASGQDGAGALLTFGNTVPTCSCKGRSVATPEARGLRQLGLSP